MWAEKFGRFVLRSRLRAAAVAMLLTIIPFFGWLGVVVVAFVTLCQGAAEGLLLLLWISLPYLLIGIAGNWMPFWFNIVASGVVVWLLATLLRQYGSWRLTLECMGLLGIIGVIIAHWSIPNLHVWWTQHMLDAIQSLGQTLHLHLQPDQLKQVAQLTANYATGVQAGIMLTGILINLILARALQSVLFAPGQWIKEWCYLRHGYTTMLTFFACLLGVILQSSICQDIFPILVFLLAISGVSLIHYLLAHYHLHTAWFAAWYIFLMISLIMFPLLLTLSFILVLTSILDTIFNFRALPQFANTQ